MAVAMIGVFNLGAAEHSAQPSVKFTQATDARPSDKLNDLVNGILANCPIDINRGWVIQTVAVDDDGVTLTMIVDATADQFASMQNSQSGLKNRFLNGFAQKAGRDGLLAQTAASNLPLNVDIVCPESVDTISLSFSPDELNSVFSLD